MDKTTENFSKLSSTFSNLLVQFLRNKEPSYRWLLYIVWANSSGGWANSPGVGWRMDGKRQKGKMQKEKNVENENIENRNYTNVES